MGAASSISATSWPCWQRGVRARKSWSLPCPIQMTVSPVVLPHCRPPQRHDRRDDPIDTLAALGRCSSEPHLYADGALRDEHAALQMTMAPRVSYTDPPSSLTIARPSAITAATIPSIRSLLLALSGFMFPAGSIRTDTFDAIHRTTGLSPCRSSPRLTRRSRGF